MDNGQLEDASGKIRLKKPLSSPILHSPFSIPMNPILIREARQMVRSRWIVTAMILYLLALSGTAALLVVEFVEGARPEFIGAMLCSYTFVIMFIASILAVVVQTVWRLAFDRIHEELSFYSTLTPSQHVRGRMACSCVLTVLFFSMAMPNLAASYLFRGVDIWIYFAVPLLLFPLVQIINLIALAIFSNVRTPLQLVCYGFLALGVAVGIWMLGLICLLSFGGNLFGFWMELFQHGTAGIASGSLSSPSMYFVGPVAMSLAVLSTLMVVIPITAYFFARCSLSPFSANRMRPIRRWMTFIMVLSFITMLGFGYLKSQGLLRFLYAWTSYRIGHGDFEFAPYPIWACTTLGILSAMLIISVCERETWEGRVRRDIPKRIFRRVLAFPFYTGSINGLAWVFLHTFCFVVIVCMPLVLGWGMQVNDIIFPFNCMMVLLYVYNCSMTAFGLWKILLHRWIPRDMIWAITLGIFASVLIAAAFLLPQTDLDGIEIAYMTAPVVIVWFIVTII
jgi:hypothetical protein